MERETIEAEKEGKRKEAEIQKILNTPIEDYEDDEDKELPIEKTEAEKKQEEEYAKAAEEAEKKR